jgi:hypothetical protein
LQVIRAVIHKTIHNCGQLPGRPFFGVVKQLASPIYPRRASARSASRTLSKFLFAGLSCVRSVEGSLIAEASSWLWLAGWLTRLRIYSLGRSKHPDLS